MSIVWREQLDKLLELQKIDARIFQLEKEFGTLPIKRKSLEDAFLVRKNHLSESEQILKDRQIRQKDRENELLSKESAVKKYQIQQMQVKTNKEYAALTHEINSLKVDCSLFEDEILRLMDEVEAQKKTVARDRQLLTEEEKNLKTELAAIDAREQAIRKELEQAGADREQYAPAIHPEILVPYGKIIKKREGLALTRLLGDSCGGCHMTVTPQKVNEIRLKEKMITCESCGRILYEA